MWTKVIYTRNKSIICDIRYIFTLFIATANIQTEILNCRMATILTMIPTKKQNLSNQKKRKNENQCTCSKVMAEHPLKMLLYILGLPPPAC